jgi:hypothetical protein
MVVSPILRGMFGLQTDAEKCQITLAPHVPADWTSFAIHNVRAGSGTLNFQYRKTAGTLTLETERSGSDDCWVEFSPALGLRTEVAGAEINGHSLPFKIQQNSNDEHVYVRFPVADGKNSIVIRVKNDFGLAMSSELPTLGSSSRGLRVLSESWSGDKSQLTLIVSGLAGNRYELSVWNPGQISSVEGGVLATAGRLQIAMQEGSVGAYSQQKVILHFAKLLAKKAGNRQ